MTGGVQFVFVALLQQYFGPMINLFPNLMCKYRIVKAGMDTHIVGDIITNIIVG
jgi:hypothetical protein